MYYINFVNFKWKSYDGWKWDDNWCTTKQLAVCKIPGNHIVKW